MNTTIASRKSRAVAETHVEKSGRFVRAGLTAGVVAAAANLVVVATARQLDVTLHVRDEAIPLVAFPQLTMIAAVIAVGLAATFTRRSRRPRFVFLTTTVVLSVLSFVPPVLVRAETSTKLVLELTHLLAALVVIPTIASRLADRDPV